MHTKTTVKSGMSWLLAKAGRPAARKWRRAISRALRAVTLGCLAAVARPTPAAEAATAVPTPEVQARVRELEQPHAALLARGAAGSRTQLPPRPKPGLELFVAPDGRDTNAGTRRQPFATLERARDDIRARRLRGESPPGGVVVTVRGGAYRVTQTFTLEAQDSGSEGAPVVFRAASGQTPVFSGGVRLREFSPVREAAVRNRLPEEVRDRVVLADLAAHGLTNVWPLALGGFSSRRGFVSHPVMELFFDGKALPRARSPGWLTIAEVSAPEPEKSHGSVYSKTGRFRYPGDRPARWAGEPELWLYGYYFFGWADSYEKVVTVDPARREITLAPPFHNYGFRQGQPFHAFNALSELDEPGEWVLDSGQGRIYFLPPSDPGQAVVEVSALRQPLVELRNVAHVALEGFTWELGCLDGITVSSATNCLLAGCTVRRTAGNGVAVTGGARVGILSCDLHALGRGGVALYGGSRKTLARGGHFVENCHVYDLSRIDHTYTPAVLCTGVGQRVAHNWLHDIPSSALRVGGNDHVIEFNEINRVVLESDDQGGVDMWGDPTAQGIVYRHNFFHHIGHWREPEQGPDCGAAGIRLDDAISGVLIQGNVFFRCASGKLGFGGVQIHGGKDNVLDNNVFADCRWAVSFSPWAEAHWREFTKGPRASPEIDPALYAARYPAIRRLDEALNVNWLSRNLVFNCGAFLHRNARGARISDNLVTTNNPGFRDPARGDFSLGTLPAALRAIGFVQVPFGEIGLYRDGHRRELPVEAIRAMRAER